MKTINEGNLTRRLLDVGKYILPLWTITGLPMGS